MTPDSHEPTEEEYARRRAAMVHDDLFLRDVDNPDVLRAIGAVRRHLFIPENQRDEAYTDGPLAIGAGQTISQPYVVASMTQHLELTPDSRVLEVGTGSGYQAAVLAEIAREVFTVEFIPGLERKAARLLRNLGYDNVKTALRDGSLGWPEYAPFDAIIVTAAAPRIPPELVAQLKVGGRMVVPVVAGDRFTQELVKVTRTAEGVTTQVLYDVRFVPMRGRIEDR